MTHYLNFIDEDDDIDEVDIEEVEEEEEEDDEEVIVKIKKKLIPRDYTFYKIYKNGCENYIGSTVNYSKRKGYHKSCCNNEKSKKYNFPVYKYIRANGGYDSFDYEILDKRFCCKVDAEIYESELMKIHKSTLNVVRNYTEEDIKEHCKECKKKYNKSDKYKEYQKKYHKQYREKKKQIHLTINLNINLPQN